MFYTSPKKNIETFIETKNEEIKSLKQKILGSRVTYEDMEGAKSRLTSLKTSHANLQKEDHIEMKEVLKTSLQAVNQLVKKKNRLLQQLQSHQNQGQQMNDMFHELENKRQKAQNIYKQIWNVHEKLEEKKQKKNRQIIQVQQQISVRRKQLSMQRQISDELQITKNELKHKINKINVDYGVVSQENKKLRENIKKQLEQIQKLEHDYENDELRIQNLVLKIEKQEKFYQILQQKIDIAQTFMQRFSQDKMLYLKEAETSSNIDSLFKMCLENNNHKESQSKECQQEIESLERKIQYLQAKRQQLFTEMTQKQQNLRELKQKGAQLKSILNSIFHQDSSVLKLLADKKVYESEEVQMKKSNSTVAHSQIKQDMLDLVATSDNFFMTGQAGF